MITNKEVLSIITKGENSGIEFKRDDLSPRELAKELVAFANFQGGTVILGVEDDGQISGIVRSNLEEWVVSVCRDKIRPAIIPYFEFIPDIDKGNSVALVSVPRGFSVHALWHNNNNRYLIRVGSQSREASSEELARLFQQKGALRTELQQVPGADFTHLDRRRLKNYFVNIRQQSVPENHDAKSWNHLLVNTEFMIDDSVTVGGMLLFGKYPDRFLPHAIVDSVAYTGVEKDYEALERNALRGPLTPLLDEDGEVVENGLVEQAIHFVRRNTRHNVTLENGRRIERPTYPEEAIREVIVNAVIHRDYLLSSTDIELAIYQDRFEVISPGRLPNGITPEHMRAGARSARNQLLKDVMRDYGYLEHMGMGVPKKIVRSMLSHNGKDPELIAEGERFRVRLFA